MSTCIAHLQLKTAHRTAAFVCMLQGQHLRNPSLDDLKAQGIYRTLEETQEEQKQHKLAGDFLQQELEHRYACGCRCFGSQLSCGGVVRYVTASYAAFT